MAQRKKVKKVPLKKGVKPARHAVSALKKPEPIAPVRPIVMEEKNSDLAEKKAQAGGTGTPVTKKAASVSGGNSQALKKVPPKNKKTPPKKAGSPAEKSARRRPAKTMTKSTGSAHKMFQLGLIPGHRREVQAKKTVLCLTAFVVVAAALVYSLLSPTGPVENTVNFFAALGSGKFPQTVNGTELKTTESQSGRVFALTDTHIVGLNAGGRAFLEKQHGFSNPALQTSAERVLVYNRESTGYSILNNSKELYRGDLKNIIYKANISDSGATAFVTESEGYAAQLSVYNKKMQLKFTWYLTDGFISDVLLSNNGKYVAVAVVTVQNGAYSSKVHCFSIKSENPIYTVDFAQTAVLSLQKFSGNWFAAVTEKSLNFLSWKENVQKNGTETNASLSFVRRSKDGKRLLAVTGASGAMTVYVFNNECSTVGQFNYNENMTDIVLSGDTLYVLNNDTVHLLNLTGQEQSTVSLERSKKLLAPCGSGVLVSDNSQITFVQPVAESAQSSALQPS